MKEVGFILNSPEGDSQTIVKFNLHKGKVQRSYLGHIRGNVVNLADYAMVKRMAYGLLNLPEYPVRD